MRTHSEDEKPPLVSTTPPWYELGMMADPILDQVLLFSLGSVRQGFADLGECLDTASRGSMRGGLS